MNSRASLPMSLLAVFIAGVLFGLGLTVSAMVNPAKVIGFLDVAGDWDPSLALVMGAGLAITAPAFQLILRRDRPILAAQFFLPTRKDVDRQLVGGAVLFGVGWGLAGLCPGPALTALVTLEPSIWLFVAAMIAGMVFHRTVVESR